MATIEVNPLALYTNAESNRLKNYLTGTHNVLARKDYKFNGKEFHTAKIVLQSIKQIVAFHSSYICGKPVSVDGSKMISEVYKKGFYSKTDYQLVQNLVTYGNAYEYVYRDNDGTVKSKVIPNVDAYPLYKNGQYVGFIERYCYNTLDDYQLEREYTTDYVKEYENGILKRTYRNSSKSLPIHYTTGDYDKTGVFGIGIVAQLIPIMNEIEQILSKMSDSVTNLSMNPISTISGQRLDESVNSDVVGANINLEEGAEFKWQTANLDYNSIKLLLDELIQQFYQVACVPSALFGQGNIANVSETSLELLFNNSDSYAKQLSFGLLEGFYKRLDIIGNMLDVPVNDIDITFNYNRPTDNTAMINAMYNQYAMGAISKKTVIKNSPYTENVERELQEIDKETKEKDKRQKELNSKANTQDVDDNDNTATDHNKADD